MINNPMSGLGRLESEIGEIKRKLQGKIDDHVYHEVNHRLDSINSCIRELNYSRDNLLSDIVDLQLRVENLEYKQ